MMQPGCESREEGRRRGLRPGLIGLAVIGALLAPVFAALANVYLLPEEALKQQFPGAEIERKALYLSREQQSRVESEAGLSNVGRFHTFYVARRGGQVVGYGIFDTHIVRTKEETLFVAVSPAGQVRSVEVVSFFEPEDYLAPQRWLNLFDGKTSQASLRPGRDLPAIAGATLTSNAVSGTVRKVLALHRVHFAGR